MTYRFVIEDEVLDAFMHCQPNGVIESSLSFSAWLTKHPRPLNPTTRIVWGAGSNVGNSTAGHFGFGMTAL